MSIEDLKSRYVKRDGPMKSWSDLPKRTEDLNGINPATTILFSAFPAVVCYLLTNLTTYLTAHFAVQFLSSDLYPVQRLAIVVRNLVVGLTTYAVSGTSASSPTLASFVSLINAARLAAKKPALGFLNPTIYSKYMSFANDITVGNNLCTAGANCCTEGYYAAAGWDPATGFGSVNFGKLYDTLFNL
jgi:hypothetical protein